LPDPSDRLQAALTGRYRLERELGAGGMATVYLAHDLRHDRQVALKVLRPELRPQSAATVLAEIKTTANLQPHILPLFDSGQVDGVLFYVMPWVDGPYSELGSSARANYRSARQSAFSVMWPTLSHARRGVVHRDIGRNVLLAGGAMVADFGIAKAVSVPPDVRTSRRGWHGDAGHGAGPAADPTWTIARHAFGVWHTNF
jgi:serine/threonine-protein kinase